MNRGIFYILYLIVSSIVNIVFTALIIILLSALSFITLRFLFHASSASTYSTALFGSFTIGLLLGVFFFSKITNKIIQKYHLDERFGGKPKKKLAFDETQEKKTVMPSSALEDEEDDRWKE